MYETIFQKIRCLDDAHFPQDIILDKTLIGMTR